MSYATSTYGYLNREPGLNDHDSRSGTPVGTLIVYRLITTKSYTYPSVFSPQTTLLLPMLRLQVIQSQIHLPSTQLPFQILLCTLSLVLRPRTRIQVANFHRGIPMFHPRVLITKTVSSWYPRYV